MQQFSLGYAFFDNRVVLIRKTHPEWQAGLYNGVGGHIEKGETPDQAMTREFKEETSMYVPEHMWEYCIRMRSINQRCIVHIFKAYTPNFVEITSMTEEQVKIFPINNLPENIIPNLKWQIPLCLSDTYKPIHIIEKTSTLKQSEE